MRHRTHRADDNQLKILEYLRTLPGVSIKVLSQVDGFVDVCVGWKGINYLWEIKSAKGKLSEEQNILKQSWSGYIEVIRSIDDVNKALGIPPE